MSDCTCQVAEEVDELGYVYIMCTEHYDELTALLERPARVLPKLTTLLDKE